MRLRHDGEQASFRAKEKQEASQKMNSFIFWSVQRFFAVRFAHSMASFAGLPESGGLRYPRNCGKLLVIDAAQHPPLAGSGVQHAPQQEFEGGALNGSPSPSNFCFSVPYLIRNQYQLALSTSASA